MFLKKKKKSNGNAQTAVSDTKVPLPFKCALFANILRHISLKLKTNINKEQPQKQSCRKLNISGKAVFYLLLSASSFFGTLSKKPNGINIKATRANISKTSTYDMSFA